MTFDRFLYAGPAYTTREDGVPAPYFRRAFTLTERPSSARLLVCGLGFYELFVNGCRLTKGFLSPYVSNPDDILYYDSYEIASHLTPRENVVGVWLGNGFFNNPFGNIWDFDKAPFRGAPRFALSLSGVFDGRTETILTSGDEGFVTAPSPLLFDDYRAGELYDAREEKPGWALPGYDDAGWHPALPASAPKGEKRLCEAEPITVEKELSPVSVTAVDDGFLYDFGENNAGVCRLTIRGEAGQTITVSHAECLKDGRPFFDGILFKPWFPYRDRMHTDRYVCRGGETESYTPTFTYHGFRYAFVTGITKEQATPSLLTFVVFHTRLRERGGFICSDTVANRLQEMTRRSTVSNFHHFPTDCPQREKNGWTADAKLSVVQTLLNLEPDRNYREWMRNIVKAQAPDGSLPGIIPTSGWGFAWGNGPAWDGVLTEIPYQLYRLRGDLSVAAESAEAISRYLNYLSSRVGSDGLIAVGLGDWCQVGRPAGHYEAPLCLTDTILSMDISRKAGFLFDRLGKTKEREEADRLYRRLREAGRKRLIDPATRTALGRCQTSQAMAIYYDLFEPEEKPAAFDVLIDLIREKEDHMDVGVLGGRILFDTLADFGRTDLALRMITRPDFPSYGEWAIRGETTLREQFMREPSDSLNHHFWGDISRFFIERIAGIRYHAEPDGEPLLIGPGLGSGLTFVEAWHEAPEGKIAVQWEQKGNRFVLSVNAPKALPAVIRLPTGYRFADDGEKTRKTGGGRFEIELF